MRAWHRPILRDWRTLSAVALTCATPAAAAEWRISEGTSALNGATTVSASLNSTQPLTNMIGYPQSATLVLRCSEKTLAAYVVWPQVLPVNSTGELFGTTQTLVIWRVDNADIAVNYWDRSNDGTAAGKFSTGGAQKILRRLASARKLVLRITARTTQDAVFELDGVDDVIARIEHTCGAQKSAR